MRRHPAPPPVDPAVGEPVTPAELHAAEEIVSADLQDYIQRCVTEGVPEERPVSPALTAAREVVERHYRQLPEGERLRREAGARDSADWFSAELGRLARRQREVKDAAAIAERVRQAAARAAGPRLVASDNLAAGSTEGASSTSTGPVPPTPVEPAQPAPGVFDLAIPVDPGDCMPDFSYSGRRHGYKHAQDITPRGFGPR